MNNLTHEELLKAGLDAPTKEEYWKVVADLKETEKLCEFLETEVQYYRDLREQGRLVELPCELETPLYFIDNRTPKTKISDIGCEWWHYPLIGHYYFLTKSEAEQALAERKE